MAAVGFHAQTAAIATGIAVKTLLQILAPTNQKVKVKEWSISFTGTSNTGTPILVEVLRQTTAGTMTSLTPVKQDPDVQITLQTTAQHTATAEPTAGDVLFREEVHPQTGYTWQAPFGGEILVQGAGRLGLRVTADVTVNAVARFLCEE